jgi:hypothetical protein
VRNVATRRPVTTAFAIEPHISADDPPRSMRKFLTSSENPNTVRSNENAVVIAVSITGLKRTIPAR